MRLLFIHGRENVNDELNDWGFDGTALWGVKYIHTTYQRDTNIGFVSVEAYNHAVAITGWEPIDEHALTMNYVDCCLKTTEGYFGDWELVANDPIHIKE